MAAAVAAASLRSALARTARGSVAARWSPVQRRALAAVAEETSGGSSASGGPPPPQGGSPPPPAGDAAGAEGATPPPPAQGFSCGGFFVAVDPNIGLWNDKVNPNWRFTFTDLRTQEKKRVPYSVLIQNKGPHAEVALRLQMGFVSCDGAFAAEPRHFEVDQGWEISVPLPFMGARFGYNILKADGLLGQPVLVTVYTLDTSFGLVGGVQKAVSGHAAMKMVPPEPTWRGDVAMACFVLYSLGWFYSLLTLPWTWMNFLEELDGLDEDMQLSAAFDAMDIDGDGYISREDFRTFLQREDQGGNAMDADQMFDALDISRTGRVTFDEFVEFIGATMAMQESNGGGGGGAVPGADALPFGLLQPQAGAASGRPMNLQPFGGAFTPGPMPGIGYTPQPPGNAGPRPPSW